MERRDREWWMMDNITKLACDKMLGGNQEQRGPKATAARGPKAFYGKGPEGGFKDGKPSARRQFLEWQAIGPKAVKGWRRAPQWGWYKDGKDVEG